MPVKVSYHPLPNAAILLRIELSDCCIVYLGGSVTTVASAPRNLSPSCQQQQQQQQQERQQRQHSRQSSSSMDIDGQRSSPMHPALNPADMKATALRQISTKSAWTSVPSLFDWSLVDAILIASYHVVPLASVIVQNTSFCGAVFMTEPSALLSMCLDEEMRAIAARPSVKTAASHSDTSNDIITRPAASSGSEADIDGSRKVSQSSSAAAAPGSGDSRRHDDFRIDPSSLISASDFRQFVGSAVQVHFGDTQGITDQVSCAAYSSGHALGSVNWRISTPGGNIAILGASSNPLVRLPSYPAQLDRSVFDNAVSVIVANLWHDDSSNPSESRLAVADDFASRLSALIRSQECAILPYTAPDQAIDFFHHLIGGGGGDQGTAHGHDLSMVIASPSAERLLKSTNILGEWMNNEKRLKLSAPEPPFAFPESSAAATKLSTNKFGMKRGGGHLMDMQNLQLQMQHQPKLSFASSLASIGHLSKPCLILADERRLQQIAGSENSSGSNSGSSGGQVSGASLFRNWNAVASATNGSKYSILWKLPSVAPRLLPELDVGTTVDYLRNRLAASEMIKLINSNVHVPSASESIVAARSAVQYHQRRPGTKRVEIVLVDPSPSFIENLSNQGTFAQPLYPFQTVECVNVSNIIQATVPADSSLAAPSATNANAIRLVDGNLDIHVPQGLTIDADIGSGELSLNQSKQQTP